MILLDSHIVLGLFKLTEFYLPDEMVRLLNKTERRFVSVSSIWELSLKYELGRLKLKSAPEKFPILLAAAGIQILPITAEHALASTRQRAKTKDPFDLILLGVCKVEKLKLMTLDQSLIDHPLAWKPKRRRKLN